MDQPPLNRGVYLPQKNNESTHSWSFVFCFVLALAVFDQLSKFYIFHSSVLVTNSHKLWRLVSLLPFKNYNFAFGLALPIWLIYCVYAVALILMVFYLRRHYFHLASLTQTAWILIGTGAVLNVGERLVLGYVRDFISIFNGVFNLADAYIIFGILIILFFKPRKSLNIIL